MLRKSVRSLALLLLLLTVGELDGSVLRNDAVMRNANVLRNTNGPVQSMSDATFDIILGDEPGQTWLWDPRPEKVDPGFRGSIALNDRGQIVGRDLLQDEDLSTYASNAFSSNAISGLGPSIGQVQPNTPHDSKNQPRIARGAGGPSQFNPALGSKHGGSTATGANNAAAVTASIMGSGVFAEDLAASDREQAIGAGGVRAGRDHRLATAGDVVARDGESLFCDDCSSILNAFVSDPQLGSTHIDGLIHSSDPLRSALLDSAFAINDLGVGLAGSGCGLDEPGDCQTVHASLITKVPEPGTLSLLGAGLIALGLIRRRSAISIQRTNG